MTDLDALRSALGLSWADLARALGVPWSTLTGWRNRGLPGAIVAIARLYAAHPTEVGAWMEAVANRRDGGQHLPDRNKPAEPN